MKQTPVLGENSSGVYDETADLVAAAHALFGESKTSFYSEKLKREVHIKPATVGSLPQVMRFFQEVVGRIGAGPIGQIIEKVSATQIKAIADGKDPKSISLKEIVADGTVSDAFGSVSVLLMAFEHSADLLPGFAAVFTDTTEKEFKTLPLEEATMAICGIFVVNYDFFTRRLLPVLLVFIQSVVAKSATNQTPADGSASASAENASKPKPRKKSR